MNPSENVSPAPDGKEVYISTLGVGAIIDHDPISGNPWLVYVDGVECRVKDQTQAFLTLVGQLLRRRAHNQRLSVENLPPKDVQKSTFQTLALELYMAEDTARDIIHQALKEEAERRWEYRRSAVAQTTRELTGAGLAPKDTVGPFSTIPIPDDFTHKIVLLAENKETVVRIGTEAAMLREIERYGMKEAQPGRQWVYRMEPLNG